MRMSLIKLAFTVALAVLGFQLTANAQSRPTRETAAAAKRADAVAKERINAWVVGLAGGLFHPELVGSSAGSLPRQARRLERAL